MKVQSLLFAASRALHSIHIYDSYVIDRKKSSLAKVQVMLFTCPCAAAVTYSLHFCASFLHITDYQYAVTNIFTFFLLQRDSGGLLVFLLHNSFVQYGITF